MDENTTEFRVPYFVMFKYMLLNSAMFAIPLAVLVFLFPKNKTRFLVILIIAALTIVAAAIATVITTSKPRAYLSPQGITVHDSKGKLQLAKWDEISNPRYRNRLGIKYMFYETPNSKNKSVLPLFLDDMESFRTTVVQLAGADNPLTVSLMEHKD